MNRNLAYGLAVAAICLMSLTIWNLFVTHYFASDMALVSIFAMVSAIFMHQVIVDEEMIEAEEMFENTTVHMMSTDDLKELFSAPVMKEEQDEEKND